MNWKVLPLAAFGTLLIVPALLGMVSWLYPTTASVAMMIGALLVLAVLCDVVVIGYHRNNKPRHAGGMMALNAMLLYIVAVRINTLTAVATGMWADYAAALVPLIAYIAITLPRVERLPLLMVALGGLAAFGRLFFADESKVPNSMLLYQLYVIAASIFAPILMRLAAKKVERLIDLIFEWVYQQPQTPPAQAQTPQPPPAVQPAQQSAQQPADTEPSLVSVVVRWVLPLLAAVVGLYAFWHLAAAGYLWSSQSLANLYWGGATNVHPSTPALICWVAAGFALFIGAGLNAWQVGERARMRLRTWSALITTTAGILAMISVLYTVQAVQQPITPLELQIEQARSQSILQTAAQ